MIERKTWVLGQPRSHLLAFVHPEVIPHDADRLNRRGDLLVEVSHEGVRPQLRLPAECSAVDLAASRVERRTQIQRTTPTASCSTPVG
jgi:hypothetical protein